MTKHKFYEIAYRAHCGTSMRPEKRAETYCAEYDSELAEDRKTIESLGGDPDEYEKRYEAHWKAWMSAKAQCLSSMITGPSGFPVRRAEKANQREHNRMQEFIDFRNKSVERLKKRIRQAKKAATDPVEEMRVNVEQAEKNQVLMVAVNKICRTKKTDAEKITEIMALGYSEKSAITLLTPDRLHGIGFASYQLINNNANIRRMRERLAELEKKAATPTKEIEREDGIRVVENTEADRLQIFFPGKPTPEKIKELKSAAFKWAPSNGCWQRQLTNNARYAAAKILKTS